MDSKERLPLARWMLVLRVIQLVFAIVVLGCSSYGIYYLAFNAYCLSLFTSIATVILTAYIIAAETVPAAKNKLYNIRATLALDIFGVIFWLSTFAVVADFLVKYMNAVDIVSTYCSSYYSSYYCYRKRDSVERREVTVGGYRDIIAVTLAFSVIEFLLFVATLVVLGRAVYRQRQEVNSTQQQQEIALGGGVEKDTDTEHTAQPNVAPHAGAVSPSPVDDHTPPYPETDGPALR